MRSLASHATNHNVLFSAAMPALQGHPHIGVNHVLHHSCACCTMQQEAHYRKDITPIGPQVRADMQSCMLTDCLLQTAAGDTRPHKLRINMLLWPHGTSPAHNMHRLGWSPIRSACAKAHCHDVGVIELSHKQGFLQHGLGHCLAHHALYGLQIALLLLSQMHSNVERTQG